MHGIMMKNGLLMKNSFAALLLALALPFVARAEDAPPPPPPPRGVVAEVPAEMANQVAEHSDVRLSKSATASTTGTAAEINAGTASWSTGVYGYDGAGNITRIGAENFVYDGVNRLKSGQVNTGAAIAMQSYTYDTYGNIKSVSTSPALATDRAISVNAATNRLSDAGYTYGDAGNLTAGAGMNYVWDGVEMVTRRYEVGGQDERYLYTADDERIAVFKRHNNTSTRTVRGLNKQALRELAGSGAIGSETLSLRKDYIYRGTQLLASEGSDGTRHYHVDHLGSPRLITNASGQKTAFHTYYPFGIEATSASQDTESHKFTGHEPDRDSGGNRDVDYMHARYYAVASGRFISVDPAQYHAPQPQSWNRYAYTWSNPLGLVDPDGRWPVDLIWSVFRRKHVQQNHVSKDNPATAHKSKFVDNNPKAAEKLIQKTVRPQNHVATQPDGRKVYERTFHKTIGTKGETTVRAITTPLGPNTEAPVTGFPTLSTLSSVLNVSMIVQAGASIGAFTQTFESNAGRPPTFVETLRYLATGDARSSEELMMGNMNEVY